MRSAQMIRCGCGLCGLKLRKYPERKFHPDCPNRDYLLSKLRSRAGRTPKKKYAKRASVKVLEKPKVRRDLCEADIERRYQHALAQIQWARRQQVA